MNRGRIDKGLVSVCLTLLSLGLSLGTAHAQIKLVKPLTATTIRITKPGSYFLGTNLGGFLGIPTITVSASNVTINLNGFSIIGPGGTTGTAFGIKTAPGLSGITIVNGTITKIHGTAIVLGSSSTVAGVQVINNGGDGIQCPSACLVTSNVITGNHGTGLNFSDTTSGYQSNVISGNTATVVGGTSLTHNVCDGSLC